MSEFEHEILSSSKVHGGYLHRVKHYSPCNDCHMTFAIFVPENNTNTKKTLSSKKMPVITYLSGLTCDDTNVSQKGNAFQSCAERNVVS